MNEIYTAFTEATGIGIESAFGNIKQIETQARQNPDIQMLIGDWDFIKPMKFSEKHQQLGQGKLILVGPKGSSITHKLTQVSTLPQVSTYVLTNEVDAGFVNLSEALAHASKFSDPIDMPQSCYRPIDLSIVAIDGRESVEGKVLLNFLASDKTKEILKRHGLSH